MPHETITYRRSKLYEEVWAAPVRDVAKRYGVSDVAIAKMCRRHGVPVPERGYWARKAAGQEVEHAALPPLPKGGAEEWTVARWLPGGPSIAQLAKRAARLAAQVAPEIAVPETLEAPHELVGAAHSKLSQAEPNSEGNVRCRSQCCIDICVSPASLDRALRITDALIKACEQRGMRFEVTPVVKEDPYPRRGRDPAAPSNTTRVHVDGELIVLRLFENYRVVHFPAPTPPAKLKASDRESWVYWHPGGMRREPNGVLELQIPANWKPVFWRDRKRLPLHLRLDEVVDGLLANAAAQKADRAEAVRRREQAEREARAREAKERKAAKRRARDEKVLRSLQNWRTARELREYAADAHKIAVDGECTVDSRSEVGRLVRWASALANRLDPFTPLRKSGARHAEERRTRIGPAFKEEEERNRATSESELVAELRMLVASWREAQETRAHVAACAEVAKEANLQFEGRSPTAKWMTWASEHANRIDPVSEWRECLARSRGAPIKAE